MAKDYIEREAVRNALYDADAITMKGVAVLNQFPAADVVEVVHGRWLPCGFGNEIMCSVCRGELDDVWEYRHCPNCGARMDGE